MALKFVKTQEIASGQIVAVEDPNPHLPRHLEVDPVKAVILILSLYSDNFFDVPRVGSIEQGWRVDWTKRDCLGSVNYRVTEREWKKFEAFLRLAEDDEGIAEPRISWLMSQPRFSVASKRYLQATFALGHSFLSKLSVDGYTWDEAMGEDVPVGGRAPDIDSLKEEVLLNYVFGLEALVNEPHKRPNERTRPTNPAERVASLIGRDDDEEECIRKFINRAYEARNGLVHAGLLEEEPPDLRVLRRCCQRALGVFLILNDTHKRRFSAVEDIVRELPSPNAAKSARQAGDRLAGLISDPSRLDRWVSPTEKHGLEIVRRW